MFEFWRFHSVDQTKYNQIEADFNILLVLLSIIVACLAAYSALVVLERVWEVKVNKNKQHWLWFGSFMLGLGVWAMHFTGMLAYMIPISMEFDPLITLISVIPSILGAYIALSILAKEDFHLIKMQFAALSMALGIGAMHFIGMEAMQVQAEMVYGFSLFVASILCAHVLATVAMYLITIVHKTEQRKLSIRLACAVVMGATISAMHYTAMASVSFFVVNGNNLAFTPMSNGSLILSLAIAGIVAVFVASTVLGALIDHRLQVAELSAQTSNIREKDIIEHLADGLFILDHTGHIDSFNTAALKMFKYNSKSFKGCSLEQLMPSITQKQLVEDIVRTKHKILGQTLVLEGRRKNGDTFPIEVNFSKMTLVLDFKIMFNCVVRDITSRVQLEDQLRHAMKLESIGQLASGIAHEINTPTQYVSDNTTFLNTAFSDIIPVVKACQNLLNMEEGAEREKVLASVRQQLDMADIEFLAEEIPLAIEQSIEGLGRISTIVGAMKSFSHSSKGEMHAVDLAEAINTTLTVARNEWRYVAEVTTDFDKSLPLVPCMRDEFNQVILNIVVNAAHAIGERYGDCEEKQGLIHIKAFEKGGDAVVTIEDNGGGMPPEVSSRIFDPFYTTKGVGKGTGQGLSMAYTVIVEQHNGQLYADSEVGKGTVFTIRLPVEIETAEDTNEIKMEAAL